MFFFVIVLANAIFVCLLELQRVETRLFSIVFASNAYFMICTRDESNWSINVFLYFATPGTYFGSHFIMGGEKFDTPQPESYLFGENADLNFLGSRPTAVSIYALQ